MNLNFKEIINKIKNITSITVMAMSMDAYRRTVDSDKIGRKLIELTTEAEEKMKKLDAMKSTLTSKEDKLTFIQSKLVGIQGRVQHLIEQLRKNKNRIDEYSESPEDNSELIETIERESIEILNRISTEITELNNNSGLDEVIESISNAGSSNQLLDNYFEQINSILSNLSSAQLGALGHIFCALSLYYCVISIASSYYGDALIVKLKLEERYPRIARWIHYRRKYSHYNIGFNLILILLLAGYMAYINISVFKYI